MPKPEIRYTFTIEYELDAEWLKENECKEILESQPELEDITYIAGEEAVSVALPPHSYVAWQII